MADLKLEDTDEYKREHSTYIATTAVAERAGDETEKLKAELAWERTKNRLEKEFEQTNAAELRLEAARKQVKEQYPAVPESLLTAITDPEQLVKLAGEIQAQIGTGDWGAPGGAPGGSTTTTGGTKAAKLKEINDRKDRVNKGDRQALDEFRRGIIMDQVVPQIAEWKGVRGGS